MSSGMTPVQFIAKWSKVDLPERAASQEHFIDLCRLLGQPTPAEHDATGSEYTFEKGVTVHGPAASRRGPAADTDAERTTRGYADVWWRGKFGWEYKRQGKYKSLAEAYRQLCQYREALENPPLLVVCDIARIEIHTNFTGRRSEVHTIELGELADPVKLDLLRRVFAAPQSLCPEQSTVRLTEQAAAQFAQISDALRQRRHDPHQAAHFLMKCMFCLFAEDVHLLPERLFTRLLERYRRTPEALTDRLTELFAVMASGGDFGVEPIAYFNGGLFDDRPALPLRSAEVDAMLGAAQHDWGAVEPSIFGTLFERSLDPDKRAQIGAHYTSREDILLIVEPVVMAPLRRAWETTRTDIDALVARRLAARTPAAKRKLNATIRARFDEFLARLAAVRILDPACGSGNFLYVAIQQLLALEKEVIVYAAAPHIGEEFFPAVRPTQLHGLEINPYAAELAQVVIWIGYLQWMRDNGFAVPRDPILAPLTTIECRDAILDLTIPTQPQPATWPAADFIIGNPPFLGSKMFRASGLDDATIAAMYAAYDLPNSSDLCCYWFEQARAAVAADAAARPDGPGVRVGLLATQGIRGGDNRRVLERIKETGDIFMAWSDRPWVLDGAAVHVSMVGFSTTAAAAGEPRRLDGAPAAAINADLTGDVDTTRAAMLAENKRISYMGDTKQGDFDVAWETARRLHAQPSPNGCANSEVLRPWANGLDVTRRPRSMWIVDFPEGMSEDVAAGFSAPYEYIQRHVRPWREANRKSWFRPEWWIHYAPRPEMRSRLSPHARFVATARVTKYRLFVWLAGCVLPDCQLIVFARSDDYFLGVLHSAVHELWARRMGTQLREVESGFRYTPTTCFETFPLPWPPGREPVGNDAPPELARLHDEIAAAARELNEQRERWLNPPEWVEQIGRYVDSRDTFDDVPADARPLIRWSAIMAEAARDTRWRQRTLTKLYNERPTWLRMAHTRLDRAVLAAYAAVDPEGAWAPEWALVWTATGAGRPLPDAEDRPHALAARRAEIDQQVLVNLLRLNLARAEAGA